MYDFISRIVTEVQESEEDFVFTTIQPFCEDVIKRKISKSDLIKLLSQPQIVHCADCIYWDKFLVVGNENLCKRLDAITTPDFFCKYGKGKEDNET